jgi:hypothetical protein
MHGEQDHRRGRRLWTGRPLALLIVLLAAIVVVIVSGAGTGLLCLLPALALMAVLVTRRYPGERLLLSRATRASERWPRPHSSHLTSRPALDLVARGGQLIARSLAVRPPPCTQATAS